MVTPAAIENGVKRILQKKLSLADSEPSFAYNREKTGKNKQGFGPFPNLDQCRILG